MPKKRRGLFDVVSEQRRFIYLLVGLLSALGVWSALTLPSAIYPELRFSRITVVASGSSLGARQVLFTISRPIEEAVTIVPGVTRVQSRSIRGGAEINITFAPSADMQFALQQVQARVNQVASTLPRDVDIEVERLTPSLFPVLSYNLEGGRPADMYDVAQYEIRPLFSRVPGVGRVDVQASDVRELEVIVDPVRLAAQKMSYADLADAIRTSSTVSAVGRMPSNYRQYLIVTTSEARSAEDVANIVIGHGLRLRDIATVQMGTEDHVRIVAGDGRPAALINITRQIGGNTVAIADSIATIAASLRKTLPPGMRLKPVYDQAALVRDAVKSVRDAMLVGAMLAVIVLLVFLRHGRITAVSASSIPLTMAITVFIMRLLGQTFNLMTLGAMAIAIGLVIDDAVVITENIARQLHLTANRAAAVREAVREIAWPVTTSTITTVVVFLPLGLLTGVEGQFFRSLSIVLSVAVLVSLALAVSIIPLLSEQFLTSGDADLRLKAKSGAVSGLLDRISSGFDSLGARYQKALGHAIGNLPVVLAACALLLAGGIVVHRFVGSGFLPEMDEGAFVIDYVTPGGTALAETSRELHIVENILMRTPEVTGISRRTGAELGLFATEQNTGDIVVRLKPESQRSRSSFEIIDDVRAQIARNVPRMRIEFVQILSDVINDLAGAARPIELKLYGSDLNRLESYGTLLGAKLAKIDGVEDVYDGVAEPAAELAMNVNAAEVNRLGMTPSGVATQVSGALLGAQAGEIKLEDRTVGIRVRAPDSVRFAIDQLPGLAIVSPGSGSAVPLGALATFVPTETRSTLTRENQQQMIDVTAGISGRSLGMIMKDVKRAIRQTKTPPGVRLEIAGQYASQQAAFSALMIVLGLAVVSVIAVMLIQFQSFIEPLVILLAAPLSFVGAMALLWVTGTPLNVSSFMGLILLVGLIVKNGIILLDFTRHVMLDRNVTLEEGIREAAKIRLRPILMTTLCTLFGLLPLALGLGAGSELQKPLALAVIGGLALSTPVTLFVVPVLLVAIRGKNFRLGGGRAGI